MSEWIDVHERLPEPKRPAPHMERRQRCLVVVTESQYPASPYDDIDSPTERSYVEEATYDADQMVWNFVDALSINAAIDVGLLEGRSVTYWKPWPKWPEED